jgi:hypothetical protein
VLLAEIHPRQLFWRRIGLHGAELRLRQRKKEKRAASVIVSRAAGYILAKSV